MYAYSGSLKRWLQIGEVPFSSGTCTAARCSKSGVIFFGSEGKTTVASYDTLSRRWTPLPAMQVPRRGCACAKIDDAIYIAAGAECRIQNINHDLVGSDGYPEGLQEACLVERFDFKAHQWSFVSADDGESEPAVAFCERQQVARLEGPVIASVTSQTGAPKLIIAGGSLVGKSEAVRNCFEFELGSNGFRLLPESSGMHVARSYAASCMWKEQLVVAGGWGGRPRRALVEVEVLGLSGIWKVMPSLNVARIGGALAVVNGFLFALGGNPKSRSVERFNEQLDCWQIMDCMELPSAVGGCVAFGLPWKDRWKEHTLLKGDDRASRCFNGTQGQARYLKTTEDPVEVAAARLLANDGIPKVKARGYPSNAENPAEAVAAGIPENSHMMQVQSCQDSIFKLGDEVEAHGLCGAAHLNGQRGVVVGYQASEGVDIRIKVNFGSQGQSAGRALRPQNLQGVKADSIT
eukprot:gnl/MRDRNA2_/MRDRNA2_274974_c0_seq1.p1 gnl/MRDRNA2_/MRDRNA2_274974_c0~~gnl/MRDRNA2_/MRDRNA2_274974_c0_seq1.p1  ORF type:complete len:529 (-),score=99.03 gnl/MRDRNA2_/MRDRNA2_274974_c0_seq1:4-1392(-)